MSDEREAFRRRLDVFDELFASRRLTWIHEVHIEYF